MSNVFEIAGEVSVFGFTIVRLTRQRQLLFPNKSGGARLFPSVGEKSGFSWPSHWIWLGRQREDNMALNKPVRRIAIVGTGVIGASWAAEFFTHSFDVAATDPARNAEQSLRKYIDAAWPALTAKGLEKSASRKRLALSLDLKATVSHVDCVQENGAERPDFKIKWFAEIDAARPTNSIIASNSSGITMSVTQFACAHPERCVIGHPFKVPQVELKEEERARLEASHVS